MKEALGDKVKGVVLSRKLKSHPVCLSTEGAISMEMEKVLNAMPASEKVKAERVLEINANHPIFKKLQELAKDNQERIKQNVPTVLIEGVAIENPVEFSNEICELML